MLVSFLAGCLAWGLAPAALAQMAGRPAEGMGSIRGVVIEAGDRFPVEGATIRGAGVEAISDAEGNFRLLGLPPGRYALEVRAPGFLSRNLSVEVRPGDETSLDVLMPKDTGPRSLTITGKRLKATRMRQMLDRIESATSVEQVSNEEMVKSGAGNVGAAIVRAPAVSIQEGRFAYVRGLGDRYSQTLVNGATLPSPEPDRRVVPLDLFPSSLVDSVAIAKSYSPNLPGEFAGGSVQIHTRDVPEEPFFKIALQLKYRDGTTLRDFETYEGGNFDAFTFDDGTRELPDEVPGNVIPSEPEFTDDVVAISRGFDDNWDTIQETAPPDHKLTISFGNRWNVGAEGTLGVVGALIWGNSYQTIEDEVFKVQQNQGTFIGTRVSFLIDSSTFVPELSGIFNLSYDTGHAQRIGLRNFFSRSGEDRVRQQQGFVESEVDRPIRITQLRWVERLLYNGQLYGEHLLVGDTFLDWRFSYSVTQRDEPDTRQVRYARDQDVFLLEDRTGSGSRDYYFLDEFVRDYGVDYAIPFHPFVAPGEVGDEPPPADDAEPSELRPKQNITLGGSYVYRDRDFEGRRFRFRPQGSPPTDEFGNPIDLTSSPEDLFQEKNLTPTGFLVGEDTRSTDSYKATQDLRAAYGLVDIRLFRPVRLNAGTRVESSDQDVASFSPFSNPPVFRETELDETDWLPAANLTIELPLRMQLRVSGSRTVSRPEFRELAEFEFTDVSGGYAARGNPNLERALIDSFDVRWEWLFEEGDIFSVSWFTKEFDEPIERVIIPTGSSLITSWDNALDAELDGFEFEARKSLGFIHERLAKFSLNANYAIIDSEVNIDPTATLAVQTNDSRPLQGQPDYTANIGLFYDNTETGFSLGILANTFGDTITGVGASGVPDEVQQPRVSLDVTLIKKVGSGTFTISGENLLDDEFQYKQGDTVVREFKRGFAIGCTYAIDF